MDEELREALEQLLQHIDFSEGDLRIEAETSGGVEWCYLPGNIADILYTIKNHIE